MSLLCHTLNAGLVVDDTLQHHHEAPRPLAKRAVGVLLQEGKQLGPDLGQHGGHVVSCQWVAVVQIHHCILQVAGQVHRGTQRSEDKSLKLPARHILFTVGMSRREIVRPAVFSCEAEAGSRKKFNTFSFVVCGKRHQSFTSTIWNLIYSAIKAIQG